MWNIDIPGNSHTIKIANEISRLLFEYTCRVAFGACGTTVNMNAEKALSKYIIYESS